MLWVRPWKAKTKTKSRKQKTHEKWTCRTGGSALYILTFNNQLELKQYSSLDEVFVFQFLTSDPVPSYRLVQCFPIINVHANHLGNLVKNQFLEFPLWSSGLRIQHCHSYGIDHSCSLDSIPDSGNSVCHGCSWKRKKKNSVSDLIGLGWGPRFVPR